MSAETLIISDWLGHATYGVNVYLASVPLEAGETRASNVTIYDAVRQPEVARKQVPDITGPALLVRSVGRVVLEQTVKPFPGDYRVGIEIRYLTRKSDTAIAMQHADQIERCIAKSLRQLWLTTAGETARTRNQVGLMEMRDYNTDHYTSNDDVPVLLGVMATLRARDTWVTG